MSHDGRGTIFLRTEFKRWGWILGACAAVAGCTTTDFVTERPVSNAVPLLKDGVYAVNAVDVRPKATRQVEPDYPYDLESILTGKAVVVFTVRPDGKVEDAGVVQADDILFGEAALSAIRKWRFTPAQVKGAPVPCRMTMPFVFVSPYINYVPDDAAPAPSDWPPKAGPHEATLGPH